MNDDEDDEIYNKEEFKDEPDKKRKISRRERMLAEHNSRNHQSKENNSQADIWEIWTSRE